MYLTNSVLFIGFNFSGGGCQRKPGPGGGLQEQIPQEAEIGDRGRRWHCHHCNYRLIRIIFCDYVIS